MYKTDVYGRESLKKETGATRVDCNMGRHTHTDAPVSFDFLYPIDCAGAVCQ